MKLITVQVPTFTLSFEAVDLLFNSFTIHANTNIKHEDVIFGRRPIRSVQFFARVLIVELVWIEVSLETVAVINGTNI